MRIFLAPILNLYYFNFSFIPLSLKTTRINSSPHNGPIKKVFPQNLKYCDITDKEILKISKSKPKKSQSCVPFPADKIIPTKNTGFRALLTCDF